MAKALITTIRDLQRRKGRERKGLALAEGVRLVEEALRAQIPIRGVVTAPALQATPRGRALEAELRSRGVPLEAVEEEELASVADTEHPQGIVSVIEPPSFTLPDFPVKAGSVVLVLDGVQDPGNVGTMARTAFSLGASGLVALKGSADLTNSKVLRASMGALFHLPAVAIDDAEFLAWLKTSGTHLVVADASGPDIATLSRDASRPMALAVGNEGAGVRPELAGAADSRVGIPLRAGAESLNVAVAAGILLYEVTREL